MLTSRIIPCLLLHNNGLVKTTKFKNPKYVGDPINTIRIFNQKEVDELIILDIDASKEGRPPNYDLIEQCAEECFMPLCYGGGIKNIQQAQKLFSIGVEKICIQTAALRDASLISQLAQTFGSQSIVVSLDFKKDWLGNYKIYESSTGKASNLSWTTCLNELISAGVGEIIINSVDRDGTMIGADLTLIKMIADQGLSIPIGGMGGVGSLSDIVGSCSWRKCSSWRRFFCILWKASCHSHNIPKS
jgi:cyclase